MVARNMAQAWFLAGDIGRAIRDYRRGLKLMPHQSDLHRDLNRIREQVQYPASGEIARAARASDAASPVEGSGVPFTGWALIAVLAWAAGWLALARAWLAVRGGLAIVGGSLAVLRGRGGRRPRVGEQPSVRTLVHADGGGR